MSRNNVTHVTFANWLLLLTSLAATAVDFTVTNNSPNSPGSSRFESSIGTDEAKQDMSSAMSFIWQTFQQSGPPKDIDTVGLSIEDMGGVAYTAIPGYVIHVSAGYIGSYEGDVEEEFKGVVSHEMTHVWQWFGNGQAPSWLIEGIADYVRLKANLPGKNWVGPGEGDRWDKGYSVTARFLDYIGGLKSGFVAELNEIMKDGYSDDFFQVLTVTANKTNSKIHREHHQILNQGHYTNPNPNRRSN